MYFRICGSLASATRRPPYVCSRSKCSAPGPLAIVVHVASVPTWTGDERWTVSPRPRRPLPLFPPTHSVPSVLRAVEKLLPAETALQVLIVPTCTGEDLLVVLPRPSWPSALFPHAHSPLGASGEIMLAGPLPINFWKSIRKNRAYRAEYGDRIKRPTTCSTRKTPPRSDILCLQLTHGDSITPSPLLSATRFPHL